MQTPNESDALLDLATETVSSCCGAGHYGPNLICEECGEHCGAEELTEE